MVERSAKPKTVTTRKLQDGQSKPVQSTQQAGARTATQLKTGNPATRSRLEKVISELQCLNEVLLSGDLDPHILANFRDALNQVRTAAWAAQQYVARKQIEQDSTSVLSFLDGERVRVTYQLCQSISEDLKRTEITVPAGSLIQLYEMMSVLTEQLRGVVNKLG